MTTQNKLNQALSKHFKADSDKITVLSPRGDDSHFEITIESNQFSKLSLIERNKLVHKIINPLFESKELHAVSLKLIPIE